jgi:hypothetical protein
MFYTLYAALSDSFEPFLKFMGVAWMLRKVILAAPQPSIHTELCLTPPTAASTSTAATPTEFVPGFLVIQDGYVKMTNYYTWTPECKHCTPGGDYPARFELVDDGKSLQVLTTMAGRGTVTIKFTPAADGLTITLSYLLTKETGEEERFRRVLNRKQ